MASPTLHQFAWLTVLLLLACCRQPAVAVMRESTEEHVHDQIATKKAYVVYFGGHSHGPDVTSADLHRVTNSHHDLLASILGSREKAKEAMMYSYKKAINGFAATLSDQDAQKLSEHPDVVSVFLSKARKLQTTHSWNWLNLEMANGTVPESSLWAKANYGSDVIIANIDTGVWPESESFSDDGFGPVPSRWKGSCENPGEVACNRKLIGAKYYHKGYIESIHGNTISGIDSARDTEGHGSHTLSTAGGNFVKNAKVLGSPVGTAKGGCPSARVAAYKACWPEVSREGGCFDADIMAAFDDAIHDGADVISVSLGLDDAADYFLDAISIGSFHAMLRNIHVVAAGGNSGPTPGTITNVSPWLFTVAAATHDRHMQLNGDHNRQVFHTKPAPEIIGFSSRGPNTVTPQILKPDISAPGVDILAAWSPLAPPFSTPYNIISGTSMATPHISAVVALLKSLYPDWSPAAIKSAIMTTARVRDNTMRPIRDNVDHSRTNPFAYGAGHVHPNRAMNPGLVYDLTPDDHFNFLCAIGYNQSQIGLVSGNPHHQCPHKKFTLAHYNYPSISVTDLVPGGGPVTVHRTLKNVGSPATYKARLRNPPGIILTVRPRTLNFTKVGEEKTFQVTLNPTHDDHKLSHEFGELVWSDHANHVVRSPIAATFAQSRPEASAGAKFGGPKIIYWSFICALFFILL